MALVTQATAVGEAGHSGLAYIVPFRADGGEDISDLVRYLAGISTAVAIVVVDGSTPERFRDNLSRWPEGVRVLPPGPWPGRNRKVAGVVTGVVATDHEFVIVADEDVRYTLADLSQMRNRLAEADVVRPQNMFSPRPWHARWDTARSLINRAFGADYPGTFGLRRSVFLRAGGYDGDVLFENLQMVRTLVAAGARLDNAGDFYIARRPPPVRAFVRQRVRQAYDDFAQPARLVAELALLPMLVTVFRRPWGVLTFLAGAAGVAEVGRRRAGGARIFPATASCWAPLWMLERSVTVWLAVWARCRGGVRYRGERMRHAALPPRGKPELVTRLASALLSAGERVGPEPERIIEKWGTARPN